MGDRVKAGRLAGALIAALLLLLPASSQAASPFQYRGVVQSFYGSPYSHSERMRTLRFMAGHDFNTYVHSPKDELHQRAYWRQPYSPAEIGWFQQEIAYSQTHGINFIPSLTPGVPRLPSKTPKGLPADPSICFSCPSEVTVLVNKFQPLWDAGVRTFMLSFDDLRRTLPYAADRAAFGEGDAAYGRANAHLLNAFLAALRAKDPSADVVTVGADYSGTRDSPYLTAIRNKLSSQIAVMWTGVRVRSRAMGADDARRWTRVAGRKPIVWENWTNQDLAPARLYAGPWQRDPGLAGEVKGFLLNASFVPETDFIPFGTAARWLRAPGAYEARSAFLGMAKEIGGAQAPLLRAFAETSYSTTLGPRKEAPSFVTLSQRFLRKAGGPGERRTARALRHELGLVRRASKLKKNPKLLPMVKDARGFFSSAARNARAGELATRLVQSSSPRLRAKVVRARHRLLRDRAITYGNTKPWSNLVYGNVMERYIGLALAADARNRKMERRRRTKRA